MILSTQNLAPVTFNHHLVARAHKKAARKRAMIIGLTLTSMVDMFSLLVIFLLQTFSTSPELLVITKDVKLPSAHTGRELKDAPVLSVSKDGVYLDQKRVGDAAALLKDPSELMERLEGLRVLWQETHPGQTFQGEINLQAHRSLPSTMISQFMAMLPSQAYGSIHLIVIPGGESG